MKVKPMEVIIQNLVEDSIRRGYLWGTQTLNWVVGEIRYSGLVGEELFKIIERLRQAYPQYPEKINDLIQRCKTEGFLQA